MAAKNVQRGSLGSGEVGACKSTIDSELDQSQLVYVDGKRRDQVSHENSVSLDPPKPTEMEFQFLLWKVVVMDFVKQIV